MLAGRRMESMQTTYPALDEYWKLRKEMLDPTAGDPCTTWAKSLLRN
jgi:hypothetical protein